jgi:dienelactone hydrolase
MRYRAFITLLILIPTLLMPAQRFGAVQSENNALQRRAFFGVGLERSADGVRVFAVTPDSTAAAAGIVIGDVIEAIDGRPADSPEAVVAAIGKHRGGDVVQIRFLRGGSSRTIEAKLKPYPLEQMVNSAVHYGSVAPMPGVNLRTIVSVPNGEPGRRYPAVLLIQGGSCGTIDSPLNIKVGQPALIHAVGSQGLVTMRVEKSGVGDSGGPPCESIGFDEEMAGYRAALSALREHASVDTQRIYLIGISLGGVFAPLLAAETKVAGIVVYGTPAAPTPPYPGRSDRFFQEFAKVDVTGAWARVAARVLVLHGEYDVGAVTNRSVQEGIARAVNSGKGSAEFRELAGLDHCWSRHASLEASIDKCGQGEDATLALADMILNFARGAGQR